MKSSHSLSALLSGAALWLLVLSPATAQQSDAPLGSPAATRVIDGLQLPAPGVPFGGTIEPNALDSRPFWSPRIAPPEGAPGLPPLKWSSLRYGF